MISLATQLNCARRELALRRSAYPGWIAKGKMTPAQADAEINAMAAIVETLEKLKLLEEVSEELRGTEPPVVPMRDRLMAEAGMQLAVTTTGSLTVTEPVLAGKRGGEINTKKEVQESLF